VLHRALRAGEEAITHGIHVVEEIEKLMRRVAENVEVDYLAVIDPTTFEAPVDFQRDVLLAGAVRVGKARLIDNIRICRARGGEGAAES
jgi:pantoate--beta-alanine ligase